MFRRSTALVLAPILLAAAAAAADLPRMAPDFAIQMPTGMPIHLSQYKGKAVVLAFILTTCSHCQKTTGFLTNLQTEYGPRGLQVLESAIQTPGAAAAVPGFVSQFHVNFPVGYNDPRLAIDFMQHPPALIPHMPLLAFIDRQGMIRTQHEGNEPYFEDAQEQNLRKDIEMILGPEPKVKKTSAKKAVGNKQ